MQVNTVFQTKRCYIVSMLVASQKLSKSSSFSLAFQFEVNKIYRLNQIISLLLVIVFFSFKLITEIITTNNTDSINKL